MINLKDILSGADIISIKGSVGKLVGKISFDSRNIDDTSLFIAVKGTVADGHDYINSAIEKGAVAIVCELIPENIIDDIAYIQVNNSAVALGIIASNFYDNPTKKLKLIGVTGTNGKTTIATLLYRTFKKLGYKTGLLSTIENYIDNEKIDATHTTPDAIQLNKLMHEMLECGCDYCFMEVSSHSIHQHRISGLKFTGGIFTNITHDHLDYHKTFKEYINAKKMFFDNLTDDAFALTNNDDKNGKIMMQNTIASKYTYSLKSMSDFKCKILESHFNGMLSVIDDKEIWLNFIGKFNAYNILAVYSTAILLKQNNDEVLTVMSELKPITGRFEFISSKNNITAIIDYAHTPDALLNVLNTIRELNTDNKQIITIIGAGGNRDKTKRPKMGKIAAEMSSKVILTSDNPRNENPETIIDEMYKGIDSKNLKKILKITDRKEAIKTSFMLTNYGDIILLAGKGHENYQEINGVKHHFDDKEEIMKLFNEN